MVGKTTKGVTAESGEGLARYKEKRDFSQTSEPSGSQHADRTTGNHKRLEFVIQKHAASHLHFDLRLELDGVMKSWAVPKGPSLDPSVKRLAMQVEDHPMEYNTFEGTIPKGQYGGGTVMLWDRGHYTPDDRQAKENDSDSVRRGLAEGKLAFTFEGERLNGAFALVRTRKEKGRAQWLLIKQNDDTASPHRDIVDEVDTSVASGRRMEEIAKARASTWTSNRGSGQEDGKTHTGDSLRDVLRMFEEDDAIKPMMAEAGKLPESGGWAIERRYEGLRIFALVSAHLTKLIVPAGVKQKSKFDDQKSKVGGDSAIARVERELRNLAAALDSACVFDGWVLPSGELVITDALIVNAEIVVSEPWLERRRLLESVVAVKVASNSSRKTKQDWTAELPVMVAAKGAKPNTSRALFLANSLIIDAASLEEVAELTGNTEVVAKRIDASYEGGASSSWRIISMG